MAQVSFEEGSGGTPAGGLGQAGRAGGLGEPFMDGHFSIVNGPGIEN
jgi:hypothetical protein